MSSTPIVITENVSKIAVPEVVEVIRVIERGEQGIPGSGGGSGNFSTGAQFPGPTIDFNGTTVTISENDYNLYSTTDHSGGLITYTIAEAILGPVPEGVPYYIVVDYTLGTPVYRATLNLDQINESDVVPVFTLGLDDQGILNIQDWDTLADGKVDMGHLHQVKHQRFSSWDGLVPSVDGALHFLHTSGRMFLGWVPHTLGAFNSEDAVLSPDPAETMCYEFAKDNLGDWASTLVQEYDNDNYNPAGGVTALGNSKFVVLWWFRGLDTVSGGARMAYVRSENQYNTPAESLAAPIRSDLPPLFFSHGALAAKTIVQKGELTADVRNLLDRSVPSTPVTNHDDLANIKGPGTYHSTQDQSEAQDNANSPTSGNPFATISEVVLLAGTQTIAGQKTFTVPPVITGTAARFILKETDAAVNNGRWDIVANVEKLEIRVLNDSESAATPAISIERTGTTIDSVLIHGRDIGEDGTKLDGIEAGVAIGERVDISSGSVTIDLSTDRAKLYFSLIGDSAITANNKTLFKDLEIIFRHGALGPFTCSWNTVDLGLAGAADDFEYLTISLPATDYQAAVKYQIGDYVLSVSIFYKSLTADNTGNTPVEGVDWTVEEPPFHVYAAGAVPLVIP